GILYNKNINLTFDIKEGITDANEVVIKGHFDKSPIELNFNKISGSLSGNINNYNIDIRLINCDLYDFLQYIFLFLQ
ncbi:MAG: hypothetical protein N2Z20_04080, partial [Elusimicrobiales bacterium]|nr:hypothetical protein [Elusimicrobiales bacterium]